ARHVSQRDVGAVVMHQNRCGELRWRRGWSFRLQYDSLIGGFDETATANSGGLARRRNYVLHAHSVLHELLGIELEWKLAQLPAVVFSGGHSGHGQNVRLDRP